MPARQLSPALQAYTRAVAVLAQPPACARLAVAGLVAQPPVHARLAVAGRGVAPPPENESASGESSPSTVPPDVETDDIGGGPNDESSSDEDNNGGAYDIKHDPGLRIPISQYDVNDQDSVRREYIALGPCQPKMKKEDFPQHECGEELHDECFAILADEPSDAYQQEQLALCLRFVNKTGQLVEWFLGLVHVEDTTSLTLKEAIKSLLIKCHLPLSKHKVKVVDKDGNYKPIQRSKKFFKNAINYHRFHADMFLGVIDRQLQELNNKFDEVNPELLRCMSSFSPAKSFSDFNVDNLVKLAKFYPNDFDVEEMNQLTFQLNRYISDVSKDENFTNLMSLADLSMMLVKTNKRWRRYSDDDDSYPSRLPINLDDRARHGDSGDGRPSFFSSALKQEESARGWGVVVEERGASAVGEVASVVVPGWFGHDTSAVDDDGNELGTTVSGDSKLAHLCDFFLSFAPFF
ncbi:Os10g0427200 [Oryza sativa Japonica Group]|uniref:Os10g0427200 protein n=1 Tax=Oryza sativa subsp. japonica TaxID=39947 RepID=C7J7A6_ORYSJ|nr:Os10g0427200 [Oryza sativa Japonica Group]|eukprot:NP_001176162.1 Os10g0427200 [Oryza sativa Japonica Group]